MNINFFENLVVIFQSEWIMFFTLLIMFTIYALKFDVSHEVYILFLFIFITWFSFLFLGTWLFVLILVVMTTIIVINPMRILR